MRLILFVLLSICSYASMGLTNTYNSKTIKVAVIDTGYDFSANWEEKKDVLKKEGLVKPKLCKYGHKNFIDPKSKNQKDHGIVDNHGHGTHIAGLIAKYAGSSNYCLVIIKAMSGDASKNHMIFTKKAFEYATRIGVDIINYSGGGEAFFIGEYMAVKKALDKGILIVAAAGNESDTVDHHILRVKMKYKYQSSGEMVVYSYKPYYIHRKTGAITTREPLNTYYPAGYDPRIISVENIDKSGKVLSSSNQGEMSYHQEVGKNAISLLPNNKIGYMTGTSQSTAIRTGKIIKNWKER